MHPVNNVLVKMVHEMLTSLGVKNPDDTTAKWSGHHFYALANFSQVCADVELPAKWADDQISAFLDLLHQKYYAAATLDAQWNALKKVGHEIGKTATIQQELEFTLVKEDARKNKG